MAWTFDNWEASFTRRYIGHVLEGNGNRLGTRLYTDLQLRWSPGFLDDRLGLAIGANNLFCTAPPPCFACGLNNFDPTTYDVPGTYFYAGDGQDVAGAVEIALSLRVRASRALRNNERGEDRLPADEVGCLAAVAR